MKPHDGCDSLVIQKDADSPSRGGLPLVTLIVRNPQSRLRLCFELLCDASSLIPSPVFILIGFGMESEEFLAARPHRLNPTIVRYPPQFTWGISPIRSSSVYSFLFRSGDETPYYPFGGSGARPKGG